MDSESSNRKVLLTWADVAEAATHLDVDQRALLMEIVGTKAVTTEASVTSVEGPWFVKGVAVRGHVGIGEEPVKLPLSPAAGLTVVSARNGVGKTSVADAIRHAVSGGAKPKYEIVPANIHYPHRSVEVTMSNGRRDFAVTFGSDGVVHWRTVAGQLVPPPVEWTEAFGRYVPVLLYPEISPIIDKPSNLHEFLKDALELAVLEELQADVKAIREEAASALRSVTATYNVAIATAEGLADRTVVDLLKDGGATPGVVTSGRIAATASELPAASAQPPSLPDQWSVDESAIDDACGALVRLEETRATTKLGADTLLAVLSKLLSAGKGELGGLGEEECPVCLVPGHGWFEAATGTATRLRDATAALRAAEKEAGLQLRRLNSSLPPVLPQTARASLQEFDGAAEMVGRWERLANVGPSLTPSAVSPTEVQALLHESRDLAAWYLPIRDSLLARRDKAVADRATVRSDIQHWLTVLGKSRPSLERQGVADRLSRKIDMWLRATREDIFKPIGDQVIELWGVLNSDADLRLTKIELSGGTQRQRKVQLDLSSGDVPVPAGKNNSAVLSTGQRNALSLATYLPRATQDHSPFGFLVLDDPIHAFDDWRVGHLAQHLMVLAQRFQVIIFTHDDRLWRELRSLGARATHIRLERVSENPALVRVKDITRPGEQMLRDLESQLQGEAQSPLGTDGARTSMTLALCRQALDTEVMTQLDVLGRRTGRDPVLIANEMKRARKTREQLALLGQYASGAGLAAPETRRFNSTIDALNGGAHGRAPTGQLKRWVKDTRALIKAVNEIGA